MYLFAVYLVQG